MDIDDEEININAMVSIHALGDAVDKLVILVESLQQEITDLNCRVYDLELRHPCMTDEVRTKLVDEKLRNK